MTITVEVSSVSRVSCNEQVLVSIVCDISERMRAEWTQALFASIVTHSEDALYSKTLEGVIPR